VGSDDDSMLLPLVLSATALAVWLAGAAAYRIVRAVPPDDRRFRDRPPMLWRLTWPIVVVLASVLQPMVPARWRTRTERALRQAGLDHALDAVQFAAGRALAACAAAALAVALAEAWGKVGPAAAASATVGSFVLGAGALGWILPASWLRDQRQRRIRAIGRSLPFYLDVITLSVESGANLTGALGHAVARGPGGPLRTELARVLRDMRAGRPRPDALRALSDRLDLPSVSSWVSALVAAERHGSGLGPILRAQAEQRRQERFQQAEKAAMQAPVKMLFPLLVFIFPCTFVLLFFPIVVRLIEEGLLR